MAPLLLSPLGPSTVIALHCVQRILPWKVMVRRALVAPQQIHYKAFSDVLLLFVTHSCYICILPRRFTPAALAALAVHRPSHRVHFVAFWLLCHFSFCVKNHHSKVVAKRVFYALGERKKWSVPQCNESVLENVFWRHWSEWQNINIHATQVGRVQVVVVMVVARVNAAKGKAAAGERRTSENVWTYPNTCICTFLY